MKIVIAPDSFKECLSAGNVCRALRRGVRSVFPKAEILSVPMADGGEGTLAALVRGARGRTASSAARDPLSRKIKARYGLIEKGKTAVIEMAEASGLHRVPLKKRNPLRTHSSGTGDLIRRALDSGCSKILLTLGGVASNDAGAGMAKALGFQFLDGSGHPVPDGAGGLARLARIDGSRIHPRLKKTVFIAACDVKNPLTGPDGSAAVYGPQKGATPKQVREIEAALRNFAKIVRRDLRVSVEKMPGAGAAGGAGAGAVAFLNAKLVPGVSLVIRAAGLESKIRGADLVITGEGRMDAQTLFGKTPAGVAAIAKKHGIPVIAFCGQKGPGWEKVRGAGIGTVIALAGGRVSVPEALRGAPLLLEQAARRAIREIKNHEKI